MINDLMYFIMSLCCGGFRQGHEKKDIHEIIDDIEKLVEDEFEKLYHKYTHLRKHKTQSLCC